MRGVLANRDGLQDKIAAKRALESYTEMDVTFPSTREFQLLQDIIEAVDQGDDEMFSDKVFQYDQLSKLDKWKTTMLLRIKESKLNPLPNLGGTRGLYLKY